MRDPGRDVRAIPSLPSRHGQGRRLHHPPAIRLQEHLRLAERHPFHLRTIPAASATACFVWRFLSLAAGHRITTTIRYADTDFTGEGLPDMDGPHAIAPDWPIDFSQMAVMDSVARCRLAGRGGHCRLSWQRAARRLEMISGEHARAQRSRMEQIIAMIGRGDSAAPHGRSNACTGFLGTKAWIARWP